MSNPLVKIAPKLSPFTLQPAKNSLAAPVTASSFVGYLPDGPKANVSGGGGIISLGPSFGPTVSDRSLLQLNSQRYLGANSAANKHVNLTYRIGDHSPSSAQVLIQQQAIGKLTITPTVLNNGPLSLRPRNPKYAWTLSVGDQSNVDVTVSNQHTADMSAVTELPYRLYGGLPTVATPSITPDTGAYTEAQLITITCATTGATIYYTLDGSPPTTSSAVYIGAFKLSESAILSVLAVYSGMLNAPIVQKTYSIVLPLEPIAFPPSGTYGASITCALSTELAGATIYYTVDGSVPTALSTQYTGPFLVSASTVVKAFATKTGHVDSGVVITTYKLLKWYYNGESGWTQASAVLIAKNGAWERLV